MNRSETIENTADAMRACIVYSLIPYLGILFVPAGIALGIFAFRLSAERRRVVISFAAISVILSVQIFLWWLLYFVPSLAGP